MTADNDGYAYIGRGPCGCVWALVMEMTESQYWRNETARHVAEMIRAGMSVDRVTYSALNDTIGKEPTFLACPHAENKVTP